MEGYIFDYRLGYVREGCILPGFDIIDKDCNEKDPVIALGDYTTPESAQTGQTWADELYKKSNGKFRIFNGCTDGYTSAHILLMFIRDVILFEPKAVFCLSGFYNIAYNIGFVKNKSDAEFLKTRPFATPKHLAFFRKITSRFGLGNQEVFYGIQDNAQASKLWLDQMAEIKCLCDEFGIQFKAVLQPCVFSGDYKINKRETAFLLENYDITESELKTFDVAFKKQYEEIKSGSKELNYITDLSGVFDNCEDVYTDACHVKEEFLPKLTEVIL